MKELARIPIQDVVRVQQNIAEQGICIVDMGKQKVDNFCRYTSEILSEVGLSLNELSLLHKNISKDALNSTRLRIIDLLNKNDSYCDFVYQELKLFLNKIFGHDICIQRRVGLSIQLPNDDSSLLPFHSDVLAGNSRHELVLWFPITTSYRTNSIFFISKENSNDILNKNLLKNHSMSQVQKMYQHNLKLLELNPFELLIFDHSLFHGNTINKEDTTRVSLNIRVKSLLTPFGEKRLGSYFKAVELSSGKFFND